MARLIHSFLFSLQVWCYFDWVQSESNWSDGISRKGLADTWYKTHAFKVHVSAVCTWLWKLPLRALLRVGSYLSVHWGSECFGEPCCLQGPTRWWPVTEGG